MEPRVVVVRRSTEYEELLHTHSTHGQAAFFLRSRGQDIETVVERQRRQDEALAAVLSAVPDAWRRARVHRRDLDRFLFEPGDLVVAVGQDGLVANVAKYLEGQPVIGINPDPDQYDGVLVRHAPGEARDLLLRASASELELELRTMVEARTDDGQVLRALNEVFIGHRTHQSARYTLHVGEAWERHSSSGLIVATGTGSTGWARSVHGCHRSPLELPTPTDPELVFFVREAFPSGRTGTSLTEGRVDVSDSLRVRSEMNAGGVLFGDGIEEDRIELVWAREVTVRRAERALCLAA